MDSSVISEVLGAPIMLNTLTQRNRMVMEPMAAIPPQEGGGPSAQMSAFFEKRDRGGIGLITAGRIIAATRGFEKAPFLPHLRFDIDDFHKVADVVHAYEPPIVAELMPSFGRTGVPARDRPIISARPKNVVIPGNRFPNGITVPGGRASPTPLTATISEIECYEDRARALVNISSGIRKRVGNDHLLGLRQACGDGLADGQSPKDYSAVAREVQNADADYPALSRGNCETKDFSAPMSDGALTATGEVATFRAIQDVPILLHGCHSRGAVAKAIHDNLGDMILLADPNYAAKAMSGKVDEIAVYTRQNECMKRLVAKMPVLCTVNPEMGIEEGADVSLSRIAKTPLEKAVFGAMKSKTLMKAANKLTGGGKPK